MIANVHNLERETPNEGPVRKITLYTFYLVPRALRRPNWAVTRRIVSLFDPYVIYLGYYSSLQTS